MAFERVCGLAELQGDGQGYEAMVADRVVAMFRVGQQIYAVDGMCAHQGGPIARGPLDANCVTCPWHGWQYDIRDGRNLLNGKHLLDCFPVEIRGQEVWVDAAATLPHHE